MFGRNVLIGAISIISTTIGVANACDCWGGGDPETVIAKTDIIFLGTAVSAEMLPAEQSSGPIWYNGVARLSVVRAVKGTVDGGELEAYFLGGGSSCDLPVSVGVERFYFLVSREKKNFHSLCHYPEDFWQKRETYFDQFEQDFGVAFDELR